MTDDVVLAVRDLRVSLPRSQQAPIQIVRGVDFDLQRGRVLGMVGESGCGKSTVADALLGLTDADATVSGQIKFEGRNIVELDEQQLRVLRGARLGLVGQDPLEALNPTMRVGRQIVEGMAVHGRRGRASLRQRAIDLMARCGLREPEVVYSRYPHELSGGMRQRVAIAMAIACDPAVLVADEPTTSLDNRVQAQVLALLRELAASLGLAVLLITHDLGIIEETADDVVVLYAGRVVETGSTTAVMSRPWHPYTLGLLNARPRLTSDPSQTNLIAIPGVAARPWEVPHGCPFAPRCAYVHDACAELPELTGCGDGKTHLDRCWLPQPPQPDTRGEGHE